MKMPQTIALGIVLFLSAIASSPGARAEDSNQSDDRRMGCVYRDATGMRFIDSSHRGRTEIARDLATLAQNGTSGAADPCISGKRSRMPAMAYAGLASRYPGKYKPLDPLPAIAAIKSNFAPQVGAAPQYRYQGSRRRGPGELFSNHGCRCNYGERAGLRLCLRRRNL